MNVLTATENQNYLKIVIENESVNAFIILILLIFTLSPLVAIFVIIFLLPFTIGTLMSIMIFSLITYYFLRLLLWNWKSKEIIEITPEEITQTFDYSLFKETTIIDNKSLELLFVNNDNRKEITDYQEDILDSGINTKVNLQKIMIQSLEYKNVCIYVNGKLKLEMIEKIAVRLN